MKKLTALSLALLLVLSPAATGALAMEQLHPPAEAEEGTIVSPEEPKEGDPPTQTEVPEDTDPPTQTEEEPPRTPGLDRGVHHRRAVRRRREREPHPAHRRLDGL